MITTETLVNVSSYIIRNFSYDENFYTLSNFQICNMMLFPIVTMLYITTLGHFILDPLHPFQEGFFQS